MRREQTEINSSSEENNLTKLPDTLPYWKGRFVKKIISQFLDLKKLNILDLGSGEGGTSAVLSGKNSVISFDINLQRLKLQRIKNSINHVNGEAGKLPFKKNFFDLVILQDVIEHVPDLEKLQQEVLRVLKKGGIIYLSTPNRNSLINIISDPHWGKPIISLLTRNQIKKFYLKYFRKKEQNRKDIAQLLTLKKLNLVFDGQFDKTLNTKFAVEWLINGNDGIIWNNFHKKLISILNFIKADNLLLKAANNNYGFINNFFTPTFYFILKKK